MGNHAKYEGSWPNPYGYKCGDLISAAVCTDLGRYKASKTYAQVCAVVPKRSLTCNVCSRARPT